MATTTTTRLPRDAQLLSHLAEPLHPERPPFYVRGAENGHPDGWYWQAADSQRASYLGRNLYFAEKRLLELLRTDAGA